MVKTVVEYVAASDWVSYKTRTWTTTTVVVYHRISTLHLRGGQGVLNPSEEDPARACLMDVSLPRLAEAGARCPSDSFGLGS